MGRVLTPEARQLLEKRRESFQAFLAERAPVLSDFAERLELPTPARIATEPTHFLNRVDAFMREQEIDEDDRLWILTRMGYYIGELLIEKLGGGWFVNEDSDSRYFLHYVVGRFSGASNQGAMVAPFEVAAHLVAQPPGRSLIDLVLEVEASVCAAGGAGSTVLSKRPPEPS